MSSRLESRRVVTDVASIRGHDVAANRFDLDAVLMPTGSVEKACAS